MALSTYSDIKTSVENWLKRSDLDAYIPDLITLGEMRIYRDLRIRAMEAALNTAISSGVLAVPSGYVAMKHAYVDASPVQWLERKTAEWIYQNYPTRSSDASPKYFAREAENFIFGPYPDSGYTIKGVYYKQLDALSDSNTTNWFTTNAPDLLLWAALCEAEPFMKNDARVALWESKYEAVKSRVQSADDREEFSGSILSVSAG
jgi:hypothetical protein